MKISLINNGEIESPFPTLASNCLIIDVQYAFDTIGIVGAMRTVKQDIIKTIFNKDRFWSIKRFLELAYRYSINFARKSIKAKIYREMKTRFCSYLSITGTVVAVADNCREFRPGDTVAAIGFLQPSLAEFALVHEDLAIKLNTTQPRVLKTASALLIGAAAAWIVEECQQQSAQPFGYNLAVDIAKLMLAAESSTEPSAERLLPFSLHYGRQKPRGGRSDNHSIELPEPWHQDNLNLYSSLAFELPVWCQRRYLARYLDFVEQSDYELNSRHIYSFGEIKKDISPVIHSRSFNKQNDKLKVGLIGAGAFGTEWLRRLSILDDISIEAIVDRDIYTAAIAAENFNSKICATSPDEIFSNDEIKIVFIVTDHASHTPLAIEALKSGKYVYLEKPHAIDLAQLEQLIATAKQWPDRLQIGFNRRYAPAIMEAKRWLAKTTAPTNIQFNSRIHDVSPNSFYYWPEQGTRIISNTCHHLDLAYNLIGQRPLSIASFSSTVGRKDENVVISITFEDGSLATILFGNRGDCSMRNSIQIMKEDLTININDFRQLTVRENGKLALQRRHAQDLGHVGALRAFIDSIKTHQRVPATLADIYWPGRLFLTADKASKSGRCESFSAIMNHKEILATEHTEFSEILRS